MRQALYGNRVRKMGSKRKAKKTVHFVRVGPCQHMRYQTRKTKCGFIAVNASGIKKTLNTKRIHNTDCNICETSHRI